MTSARVLHRLRVEEIRQGFPAPTMLYKTVVLEKPAVDQTLGLGDVILHARPGSEELFECTVMDLCNNSTGL